MPDTKIDEAEYKVECMRDSEVLEALTPLHHHEALHTAMICMDLVDGQLLAHSAIEQVPERKVLAEKAHQALFDLYQLIGQEDY